LKPQLDESLKIASLFTRKNVEQGNEQWYTAERVAITVKELELP